MRIVSLTAGAAGMYCGSCLRDRSLVTALRAAGHDALLVPLYTPLRTDDSEADLAEDEIFYGGINVYLQQRLPWLRYLPATLDGWLNRSSILRRLVREPGTMTPQVTGAMTLSMLAGEEGRQRKELRRLVEWLQTRPEGSPEVVLLSNFLIGGCLPALRQAFPHARLFVTLQGDDLFLDSLLRKDRVRVLTQWRRLAPSVDRFVVYSRAYRDAMADLLGLSPERFAIIPLGVPVPPRHEKPAGGDKPLVIGYLARICPHKGLHLLVHAFLKVCQIAGLEACRLRIAGWLGKEDRAYWEDLQATIRAAGATDHVRYEGVVDAGEKRRFFEGVDVFSVPSVYPESKGLSVVEAMAAGCACVQPAHGIFPELLQDGACGRLIEAGSVEALVEALLALLQQASERETLGMLAREHIESHHRVDQMVDGLLALTETSVAVETRA